MLDPAALIPPVTRGRPWLVALGLLAVVALAAPAAHASGKNVIRGVSIRDDAGTTSIRIQGTVTPTFTVYKLERPTRVVVDVARASLDRAVRGDEPSATFAAGTWAVSQVAAQAVEDGASSVRVVVTLARPGRYDVKADGKDVVVTVTARDAAPRAITTTELASARADADAARAEVVRAQAEVAALQRTAQAARQDAERARAEAQAAQQAAEREQARARDAVAAAAAARQTAEAASRSATTASSSERAAAERRVAEARAEAERARAEAERARTAAARAQAEARVAADKAQAEARAAADKAQAEAKAAAAAASREVERAQADAARERTAAVQARAAADRDRAAAEQAQAEADRARASAAQTQAAAERERVTATEARAAAERERQAAAQARAEADRTTALAQQKLAALETERKQAVEDARRAAQARDEARQATAQAEAREREARAAADRAGRERQAAEQAMKQAEAERARAAGVTTDAGRARATADARMKEAEARLARAEEARRAAEQARARAEQSLASARKDASAAQAAVAAADQARVRADAATREAQAQRAAAEARRAEAEQRRADTLAAAEQAEARRARAEQEAQAAAERRKAEEAAMAQAVAARRAEEAAAARARAARTTEEDAARAATAARAAAEQRKEAAERAAAELEAALTSERAAARVARERKQAADAAADEAREAERRRASSTEIAAARAEAERLARERTRAERELADKSKEVAASRADADRLGRERAAATAEVARLKQAADEARAARAREEARLAEVAAARAAEEQALVRARAAAARAAAAPAARAAAPVTVAATPAPAAKPMPASAPAAKPAPTPAPAAKPTPAPAASPPAAKPAARVAGVRFAPADAEHAVVIDLEGKGASAELVATGRRQAELVVRGATLPASLARTLDTSRFGGPVRAVSSYTDPATGDVRVVVDLAREVTPRLDTSGGGVRLAFATGAKVQSQPAPVVGGFGATSTPVTQTSVAQLGKKKVYRGPTIELDFKDADIHDLLRTLADVGRVNIVVPDEIRATVTVRMKRVPWDQALEVILASKGLWYRKEGNLYRVAQRKLLDAEDEAEAARLRAMVEMEAPKPEVYTLNYTDAASTKPTLEPLLSPKGKIEVDVRTNSLIVNDVARNRREIIALAARLDTQTPQISIEARIVEARSAFERQIGIQWGGRALAGAAGGSATGLIFPSTIGFQGGAGDQQKTENGVAAPADFAVNLPAAGTNGAIGMTLGSVGGNVNINLRLSALEETGTVRIISAPKVTVLNNIEAEMKQGVKIPISIVSAEGTQTQFVNALLSLKVTPYVSQRDCTIMMDVRVTKDEPDFVNTGARGDPTILNKEAKTRMLVADGETSVMGGIYTRNTGLSYSKIPLLGDIPVFGWLFKNRRETDDRAELLIFITPKITNKASLRCTP